MKKIAIISDIKGNIEALKAVFSDIEQRKVETIYCLGDIIGFSDPRECLDEVFKRCKVVLLGDYEQYLLTNNYSGVAFGKKEEFEWIRCQLKPSWRRAFNTRIRWEILKKLPLSYIEDDFFFVHGSPRNPTNEYILTEDMHDLFDEIPEKITGSFQQIDRLCFIGHNHRAGLITQDAKWIWPKSCNGSFKFSLAEKYIISVGSVGQPLDGDNRASYVICDGQHCNWHRTEYDIEKTIAKIENNSEFPGQLKYSLIESLLTGRRVT
jgi:diadenosine tetraphosphatase ApaH/serine/threonine PP2A family protein phosphatase